MGRVIGVVSGKGGVGKTVVSINLAAALRTLGRRVLLVDFNPTTSHVGLYLGMFSTTKTLNDVLRNKAALNEAVYEHASGIHVLPASINMDDLKNLRWDNLRKRMANIIKDYDYVILDGSPGFGKEAVETFKACDELLFVTTPHVHTAADLLKCKQIAQTLNLSPLGIVLNMVRNKKYELTPAEVMSLVEEHVISSIPFDDSIMESIVHKRPVATMKAKSSKHFHDIARYVEYGIIPQPRGFWSRLFGRSAGPSRRPVMVRPAAPIP